MPLQQSASYNLGNTKYRLGQKTEKENPRNTIKTWEEAVKSYDAALQIKGSDPDAKHNRDFVQRKIEQLKKQEEQKKQDQQKQQDQKNQQQNNQQQQNKDQKSNDQQNQSQNQQDDSKDQKVDGKNQPQDFKNQKGNSGEQKKENKDSKGEDKEQKPGKTKDQNGEGKKDEKDQQQAPETLAERAPALAQFEGPNTNGIVKRRRREVLTIRRPRDIANSARVSLKGELFDTVANVEQRQGARFSCQCDERRIRRPCDGENPRPTGQLE